MRLEDGLRVHAVLATGGAGRPRHLHPGPFGADHPDLAALQAGGMFDAGQRAWLEGAVARRENLLVTGAAGAGKTTLLAALLGCAAPTERIITIEDVAELRIDHPHHVRLEARQPNLEGAGGIGLARLVREALRMRPDRLVVGECRGEEVRELRPLSTPDTTEERARCTPTACTRSLPGWRRSARWRDSTITLSHVRRRAPSISCCTWSAVRHGTAARLAAIGRAVIGDFGRLAIEDVPWAST